MAVTQQSLTGLVSGYIDEPAENVTLGDLLKGLVYKAGSAAINDKYPERTAPVSQQTNNTDTAAGEQTANRISNFNNLVTQNPLAAAGIGLVGIAVIGLLVYAVVK